MAVDLSGLLTELREQRPLVHNITNFVAMDLAANSLLAIGASPAMAHAAEEVAEFVEIAGALTINSGTMDAMWYTSAVKAAQAAAKHAKPWVYDPVGVGATRYRRQNAREFLSLKPNVIRGNASEILTLCGSAQAGGKGVDATGAMQDISDDVLALSRDTGAIVVASGETDYISDGRTVMRLNNGHFLMPKVTAMGCTLTAIIGAFLAVSNNTLHATLAAVAAVGIAGELAGERIVADNKGPASFRVGFVDALYFLNEDDMEKRIKWQ